MAEHQVFTQSFGDALTVAQETMNETTMPAGVAEDQKKAWQKAQKEYAKWTNTPLPKHYLSNIVDLGKRFQHFIGKQGRCLDVGCGNGLISGKHYKDVGYSYLDKGAIGVDPLSLQGFKPTWLKEYTRGICEYLAFKNDCFDTVVFATTLDHVQNIDSCLQECRRVLRQTGTLNIWLTCPRNELKGQVEAHPNRMTQETLEHALTDHGFEVTDKYVTPFWGLSRTGDQVSSGNTVFIKAKKQMD